MDDPKTCFAKPSSSITNEFEIPFWHSPATEKTSSIYICEDRMLKAIIKLEPN